MASNAPRTTVRFGDYEVDLRSGELAKNGIRIRLQEKPLRVLSALIEQNGQLVTREELHRRLWPDTTFVDFEVGLNTAVKKLRVALCDDAEEPRYIETIPRRGYRFVASVETLDHSRGDSGETPDAPPSSSHILAAPDSGLSKLVPATHRFRTAAAISAVTLLIAFGFWWSTPLADPKVEQIFPLTSTARLDYLVRPATDGARLLYVQRAGDHYVLMQTPVTGGDAQMIPAPFPNTLIWDVSPDNSQYLITSFRHRGEASQLWSWPATGGSPVKLDDMISGSAVYSPDGRQVAFHLHNDLWIGNADGSAKRKLGTFAQEVDDPAWAPEGDRLRFNLKDPQKTTNSIWEIRLDGTGLRQILADWSNPSQLCCGTWTPDGRYFIFVEISERSRVWALREKPDWFRRSPPGPFLLVSEADGARSPLVGRDGKHIYYYTTAFQTELRTLNVTTRQFATLLPGLRAFMPALSRDGTQVAFVRSNFSGVWRSRIDGSDLRQLPVSGVNVGFPRWSPDGKNLVFSTGGSGTIQNDYVIDADGGHPAPLVPGHDNLGDPDWAPDGSMLVVRQDSPAAPNAESTSQLALVTWNDRQVRNIPGSSGMGLPRWSPDGRSIASVGADGQELHLYDLAGNRWRTLARGKGISLPVWSADGAYLYYQDLMLPGEPLQRVRLSSGKIESVFEFHEELDSGVNRCVFVALSPDGKPIVNFDRSADIHAATIVLP